MTDIPEKLQAKLHAAALAMTRSTTTLLYGDHVKKDSVTPDQIATLFNMSAHHKYWRATVGGSRARPEIHFVSRASMVRLTYHPKEKHFTVSFSKATGAFGDFMASIYRSLAQIQASLKAAGLPFHEATGSTVARIEFDPATKFVTVHLAGSDDDWMDPSENS